MEDGAIEGLGGLGVVGLALVPRERPGLVRELRAVVLPGLLDAEGGAGRILRNQHPAGVEHVHRLHDQGAARVADLACGGIAAATCLPSLENMV